MPCATHPNRTRGSSRLCLGRGHHPRPGVRMNSTVCTSRTPRMDRAMATFVRLRGLKVSCHRVTEWMRHSTHLIFHKRRVAKMNKSAQVVFSAQILSQTQCIRTQKSPSSPKKSVWPCLPLPRHLRQALRQIRQLRRGAAEPLEMLRVPTPTKTCGDHHDLIFFPCR